MSRLPSPPRPPPRAWSRRRKAGGNRDPGPGRPGRSRALRQHLPPPARPGPGAGRPRAVGSPRRLATAPRGRGSSWSLAHRNGGGNDGGGTGARPRRPPPARHCGYRPRLPRRRGRAPHVTRTRTRHCSAGGTGRGSPVAMATRRAGPGLSCPARGWLRAAAVGRCGRAGTAPSGGPLGCGVAPVPLLRRCFLRGGRPVEKGTPPPPRRGSRCFMAASLRAGLPPPNRTGLPSQPSRPLRTPSPQPEASAGLLACRGVGLGLWPLVKGAEASRHPLALQKALGFAHLWLNLN